MIETIEKLVHVAPAFSAKENGSTIHDYFEGNKEAEGVVIIDGDQPVGILMRHNFYQKIGRQFGYSLYMKRDVALIMKPDITCVDKSCDMATFGFTAMNRNQDSIYDFIVVLENGAYAGIVSISEFLIEMSKTKEREIALLNEQQHILKQANDAEKIHRMEMEQKNAAIKNLLDHAGQGFLFFGSDLYISEEYSKECDEIFGFSVGNLNFTKVMEHYVDENCIDMIESVFDRVFHDNDKIRNKVYLSVLPSEIRVGEHYIQTEYKVIPDQTGKSVMMILTDITEKKALELKTAEEKNNIKLIVRAIRSKSEIDQAIDDLREFLERGSMLLLGNGQNMKSSLQQIFREVHTMKGDFALNALHHTSAELHRLEDAFSVMLKNAETVRMSEVRDFMEKIDCDGLLQRDLQIITDALGTQFFEKDDIYSVSRQRILELKRKIKTMFREEEQDAMILLLDSLFYLNVKDILKNYNDYIKIMAERFGKSICEIKIAGKDIYISRTRYYPFLKSLVHVLRNMADHGIEDPEERIHCGKTECGEISCKLEEFEDKFILSMEDDGKGIDLDAVTRKMIEKGICSEAELSNLTREEILKSIFLDDFSTKSTVDLYSGRGVGMAAVHAEVDKLDGTITVDTEKGKYTRFTFVVPMLQP